MVWMCYQNMIYKKMQYNENKCFCPFLVAAVTVISYMPAEGRLASLTLHGFILPMSCSLLYLEKEQVEKWVYSFKNVLPAGMTVQQCSSSYGVEKHIYTFFCSVQAMEGLCCHLDKNKTAQ